MELTRLRVVWGKQRNKERASGIKEQHDSVLPREKGEEKMDKYSDTSKSHDPDMSRGKQIKTKFDRGTMEPHTSLSSWANVDVKKELDEDMMEPHDPLPSEVNESFVIKLESDSDMTEAHEPVLTEVKVKTEPDSDLLEPYDRFSSGVKTEADGGKVQPEDPMLSGAKGLVNSPPDSETESGEDTTDFTELPQKHSSASPSATSAHDKVDPEIQGTGRAVLCIFMAPSKSKNQLCNTTLVESCMDQHDHGGQKIFKCKLCRGRFFSCGSLKKHVLTHTIENEPCTVKKHKMTDTLKNEPCNVKDIMLSHTSEKTTGSGKNHVCEVCGKSFERPSHMKNHMAIHTGERNHVCDICHKAFAHPGNLCRHMLIHSGPDMINYSCSGCKKLETKGLKDDKHKSMPTVKKKCVCNVCKKELCRPSNLKLHMMTHTGGKNHVCTVCQSSFSRSENLKRHMVTHTGERNYVCCVCQKAFNQPHHLKEHMNIHSQPKRHICGFCQKAFSWHKTLQVHIQKQHIGEEKPQCM